MHEAPMRMENQSTNVLGVHLGATPAKKILATADATNPMPSMTIFRNIDSVSVMNKVESRSIRLALFVEKPATASMKTTMKRVNSAFQEESTVLLPSTSSGGLAENTCVAPFSLPLLFRKVRTPASSK